MGFPPAKSYIAVTTSHGNSFVPYYIEPPAGVDLDVGPLIFYLTPVHEHLADLRGPSHQPNS